MRVMTILGSPRRRGNTARVLEWVEAELRANGHEIDRADIADHHVKGCGACWVCKEGSTDLCAVEDDDANALLQRMIEADCVLLAAPVFCWSFPAQMKALTERMFSLVGDYRDNPDYGSRLEGKAIALLATSGGEVDGNAELLARAFANLVRFQKAKHTGQLLIPRCVSPDALGPDVRERAIAFARLLMSALEDKPDSAM